MYILCLLVVELFNMAMLILGVISTYYLCIYFYSGTCIFSKSIITKFNNSCEQIDKKLGIKDDSNEIS